MPLGSGPSAKLARSTILEPLALNSREGLSLPWQCAVFLLVIVALFSRRPDMFLNPQFYAEDGKYWYAQAYNLGWLHSLAIPLGGYLNTLPRLVAGITLLFPFRLAPLIMNLAGMLIQALPVTILLSARCRDWGSLPSRLLMVAIYVAIPSAFEVHVVLTNAQWHLALAEILLAFSATPRGWPGRMFDVCLFLVAAVSGPFPILILPLLLIFWWKARERWSLVITGILSCGAIVQLLIMLFIGRPKIGELGATPMLFLRMLGGNIFLDALLGPRFLGAHWAAWRLVCAALFGLLLVAYICTRANLELRLLAAFSGALLIATIHAPFLGDGATPLWQQLLIDPGGRYWYFPILTFLWSLAWCAFSAPLPLRLCAFILLAILPIGVVHDWRYPPFDDHHFPAYAEQFEHAAPGETVRIPIPPVDYQMELTKRSRDAAALSR